jgi:hypothetical protein
MNSTNLIHRIPYVILYKIIFKKYCTITCICSCISKNTHTHTNKQTSKQASKQTNTFHRSKICSTMIEYETGQNNTWCSYTTSSQDIN